MLVREVDVRAGACQMGREGGVGTASGRRGRGYERED